jgi:hypothetical protein
VSRVLLYICVELYAGAHTDLDYGFGRKDQSTTSHLATLLDPHVVPQFSVTAASSSFPLKCYLSK